MKAEWEDMESDDSEIEDFDDPRTLGIRTSEYLEYRAGGNLGVHDDNESIYTVLISLSDPESYEGGEYFLELDDEDTDKKRISVKPSRLSALVFVSEVLHGVKPILSGERISFATEFWIHDDLPFGELRPGHARWEELMIKFHGDEWTSEDEDDEDEEEEEEGHDGGAEEDEEEGGEDEDEEDEEEEDDEGDEEEDEDQEDEDEEKHGEL